MSSPINYQKKIVNVYLKASKKIKITVIVIGTLERFKTKPERFTGKYNRPLVRVLRNLRFHKENKCAKGN
jgi:hypothetical protein